jgi:hypothetical protein
MRGLASTGRTLDAPAELHAEGPGLVEDAQRVTEARAETPMRGAEAATRTLGASTPCSELTERLGIQLTSQVHLLLTFTCI